MKSVKMRMKKKVRKQVLMLVMSLMCVLFVTGPSLAQCVWDSDTDGDVDGADLQSFASPPYFSAPALGQFASEFGLTDCNNNLPPDPTEVAPTIDPTISTTMAAATAFLYSGENPIQSGVVAGTIEGKRVAVLRGKVSQRDGSALPGVNISVHGHPEYGWTKTRADGAFDLAVNGGGHMTIDYAKAGYLPVQRNVEVPWQDYVWMDEVVMIQRDSAVTTVDLNAPGMQVVRGSEVNDSDGARQGTILIPSGTQAQIYLPNGSTQPVDTLNIRITEFTVGDTGAAAMPAELPPTSAFTYAVELGADEVSTRIDGKEVLFNQPVYYYVENFLNFPAGTVVPVGYYDDDHATWLPSDNGIVIKILGVTGNLAELDVDGTGIAADEQTLADLGFSETERQNLATLYPVGQSLWRVPMIHLSTWDANWSWGPPLDAEAPRFPLIEWISDLLRDDSSPCKRNGSIIECQNQILGEAVPVAGTPFYLHYNSDRVPGRSFPYTLKIPISGETLPASLKRIDLEISVAGQEHKLSFIPLPNQTYSFTWDGKDAYGRTLQGPQPISFRLGYVYDGYYQGWSGLFQAFGEFGNGIPISASPSRGEFIMWQEWKYFIGGWDARGQGLGGWTLSVQHSYNPASRILYPGTGGRRRVNRASSVIQTVAGGGSSFGDGGPATDAQLDQPSSIAFAPGGTMYIASRHDHRIRKVTPEGIISTFAGGGGDVEGNNIPATWVSLNSPEGVALGPDGSVYIADTWHHRIRRVGLDGLINTVAGTGVKGYSGDGGPAVDAQLFAPKGIAVGPDGSLYIADKQNNRIRKVSPSGVITTIAGDGIKGYGGDGGLAIEAQLSWPTGIAIGSDGAIFVSDSGNKAVRRIGVDGMISTLAIYPGGGYFQDIDISEKGDLYVATDGLALRVSQDGTAHPIAGENCCGFGGDGGPALSSTLAAWCNGIAVGPDGFIYLADTGNHRVRSISPPLPAFDSADIAIPSEDGSVLYQFSPEGRHLATVNALNGESLYTFSYDESGLLVQITDSYNNTTTIEHDAQGNPTAIVAPFGQRTELSLDAQGYLHSITDPENQTYTFTYVNEGLMETMTDPNSNVWTFSYDPEGRLLKDQDPSGGFSELSRTEDQDGYSVTLTTAENESTVYASQALAYGGVQKTFTFPNGSVNQVLQGTDFSSHTTYADGTVAHEAKAGDPRFSMQAPITDSLSIDTPGGRAYRLSGQRTATFTDPDDVFTLETLTDTITVNGHILTRTYSADTKTWTEISPEARESIITVNKFGQIKDVQVTGLEAYTFTYDGHGRIEQMTHGGRQRSYSYDAGSGYLQALTNPLSETTGFARDNIGRITALSLPDSTTWRFDWDKNSNVTVLTEPDGSTQHNFTYTKTNLVESYESPMHAIETFFYDKDKRMVKRLYPSGNALEWIYSSAGQLTTFKTPEGEHSFTYNSGSGLLESAISRDGQQVDYSYDGRLLTSGLWTGVVNGTVGYTYNDDLHVSQMSYGGISLPITYDNDGLLTAVGGITITRDSATGLVTGLSDGSFHVAYSHNGYGEINSMSANHAGVTLYQVTYSYDNLGRISQKIETMGGISHTWDYEYDSVGQLITVKRDTVTVESYTYDEVGNRISMNNTLTGQVLVPADYSYDSDSKLLAAGTTTYSYDPDGRLHSVTEGSTITTYDYNTDGTLASVDLADGRRITYLYDHRGRRIARAVDGVRTHSWLYGQGLMPLAEYDGGGSLRTVFIYGTGTTPTTIIRNGATYHIITDQLGSPRLVVDDTGAVIKRIDYDTFGNMINDTNPSFDLVFGFAGGMADPDHELTRFGARDYQPSTGRWTAKDPILFRGGLNLYEYVGNNALNRSDLSGLQELGIYDQDYPDNLGDVTLRQDTLDELFNFTTNEIIETTGAGEHERFPFADETTENLYETCTPESDSSVCEYICSQMPETCKENRKKFEELTELSNHMNTRKSGGACEPPRSRRADR